MNRKWTTCVAVLVALVLAAGSAAARDLPIFPDKKPGEMYFRIVSHGGVDPYWAVVHQGMLEAVRQLGARADMDLCNGDLQLQLQRFREAVAMGVDGIGLVINDDTAWDRPVAEALAAGIPVIALNNDDSLGALGNPRLAFIGQYEREAARMLARRLFEAGRARGVDFRQAHVLMAAESAAENYAVMRSEGVKEVMTEFGINSFVSISAGGVEPALVRARMTAYLVSHPETTFLIGLGSVCTDNMAASLSAANRRPGEIVAGGFDLAAGTIAGLKNGYVEATVDAQQYLQGYYTIMTLSLVRRFGFRPNDINTGGYLVDRDSLGNIDKLSRMTVR